MPGLEPTTWLGKLEELLTGRSFDDILADPTGAMVASRDGGERLELPMTESLQRVLVSLPDDRVDEVGLKWAADDEFHGPGGDAAVLGAVLRSLRALALSAQECNSRVYCWLCV